jgi:hypothetical protein
MHMKTDNKVEINAIYGDDESHFTMSKNFIPRSISKFNTLLKNATTMMQWNHVSRIVIYMPDNFVNKNYVEVKPTIIEE